jgi:hypothetical protein
MSQQENACPVTPEQTVLYCNIFDIIVIRAQSNPFHSDAIVISTDKTIPDINSLRITGINTIIIWISATYELDIGDGDRIAVVDWNSPAPRTPKYNIFNNYIAGFTHSDH